MRFPVTNLCELLVTVLNDRRTFIRAHRRDSVTHIRNPVCVRDDNLLRFLTAQIIRELIEHLLCRAKVQWRLIIRVLKSLPGHDNPSVHFVLRVQKMHIAGGNHWFLKLLSKLHHPLIERDQILLRVDVPVPFRLDHKPVIADWLNLKIIIKRDNLGNLLLTLTVQHRAKQLSRLAGAA